MNNQQNRNQLPATRDRQAAEPPAWVTWKPRGVSQHQAVITARRQIVADRKACAVRQVKPNPTSEELVYIALLQSKASELGRLPSKKDIGQQFAKIKRLFGNWPKALKAAGLIPKYRKPSAGEVKKTAYYLLYETTETSAENQ